MAGQLPSGRCGGAAAAGTAPQGDGGWRGGGGPVEAESRSAERGAVGGAPTDRGSGAHGRSAAAGAGFFSASLAASQREAPAERRAWRCDVYTLIEAMTSPLPQGGLPVERLCALAGVSRAGYYRHWRVSAPRQEETAMRDAIQRVALTDRHYGHRRIAAQLRREGLVVNLKRVLRLTREDNLLCL